MIQNLKKAIVTSIFEVLETMLFMIVEFDEKSALAECNIIGQDKITGCMLKFTGPISGTFILWVPDDQLHSMTADFMGLAPDKLIDEHTSGTIKEVINMVAGNAFGKYDDKVEFKLGIPELLKKGNNEKMIKEKGSDEIFIKVNTPDSFIAVKVIIQ